jgi:intraflagellar transport protein 88
VHAIKVSSHSFLAGDLEINKAVMFLKQKELPEAIDTLRSFEKKETKVASAAATNLAFIHFLVSYKLRRILSRPIRLDL